MPRCPLSLVEFDNVADGDKLHPILCTRRLLRLFVLRLSTLRHPAKRFADVLLNSLTSGECFGVCNLLAKAELKTVLRCAEDTTILYVTKPVLLSLMKQKVDFAVRYAEMCNQKIQFLIHRIELLTMQSCRGRVIAYLLEKKDASNLVHVTVSREDLARQLGVSRAALFRELSTLQGRNAISAEGNTIHLSDVTLLEDILYHSNDTK